VEEFFDHVDWDKGFGGRVIWWVEVCVWGR
jgi:hypothetical protein